MALFIGQEVDDFELPDIRGTVYRLSDYRGKKIVVLIEWSVSCTICKLYISYLNGFAKAYKSRGVVVLGIDSHVWDTKERIDWALEEDPVQFPLLYDKDGDVAKMLGTSITPTAYIVDKEGALRYMGAIDDRNDNKRSPDVHYLEDAVDSLLLDTDVEDPQNDPWGCELELE